MSLAELLKLREVIMSKTNRWHLEEEHKLLADEHRCRAYKQAFDDGYDCNEELHANYAKYVYEYTAVKIDTNEARWDCETFHWNSDIDCDLFTTG
jgi:hypothetical protein